MEKIELKISDGSTMGCYIARPAGEIKGGLVVLQEAFGVNAHIKDVTERFAKEGYLAIAPELFHRTAPGFESEYVEKKGVSEQMDALTDEGLLADVISAHAWLKEQGVDERKIGVTGYCMGGRTAFLANASIPFGCAISYYGGGIAQSLLTLASAQKGPLLFFWGGKDGHILAEHRTAVTEALTAAEKSYANVEFSYAGHGFFCDARASYNAQAARQAWALTLQFLKETIG